MRMNRTNTGFTIVELLIVIVIIGILAAIVIVAYNGITSQARESTARADLSNFHKKLELFKVDNGRYPTSIAEMNSLHFTFNRDAFQVSANDPYVGNLLYCRYDNSQGYVLQALTANNTQLFISSKSGAPREYTGTDTYVRGDWGDSCRTHATNDTGTSVVEPDFEDFTNYIGSLPSGAQGTPDFGVAMGYFNSANRTGSKWHSWTSGGN